jgi:outer membrane biosynthesis protein TonB
MERAERVGLGVATAGHVLLFALLSSSFLSAPKPLKLNSPPMDVSLVDEVALKSTAPQISTEPPPPSEAPEKGPTEDAAPAPEPAPAPESVPTPPAPKPRPAPESTPAPPKPAPKPTPAPPKKVAPKPTPAKPKPAPEKPAPAKAKPAPEKPAPAKAKPTPEKPKTAAAAPAASKSKAAPKVDAPAKASGQGKAEKPRGSRLGSDFLKGIDTASDAPRKAAPPPAAAMGPQQKAALDRLISQQIYPHLHLPSGADVELLVASLDVRLDKDGSVIGKPTVIDITGVNASNSPQAALYKERAIQAVMQASPFRGMPPEFYAQWNHLSPLRIYARKAQ